MSFLKTKTHITSGQMEEKIPYESVKQGIKPQTDMVYNQIVGGG